MVKRNDKQEELWRLIQYLNLSEMKIFCRGHDLPMHIRTQRSDGRLKKTNDRDRKDIILERIMILVVTGKVSKPTVYISSVVSDEPFPNKIDDNTRICYGQYDKKNSKFLALLKSLTNGSYRHGMISRLVLRDFWTSGPLEKPQQLRNSPKVGLRLQLTTLNRAPKVHILSIYHAVQPAQIGKLCESATQKKLWHSYRSTPNRITTMKVR